MCQDYVVSFLAVTRGDLLVVERDDGYARLECELESAIAHLSNCATDFTDHTDVCVSLWPC